MVLKYVHMHVVDGWTKVLILVHVLKGLWMELVLKISLKLLRLHCSKVGGLTKEEMGPTTLLGATRPPLNHCFIFKIFLESF